MNRLRIICIALLAAGGLPMSGCVWEDQNVDDTADNVIKGLSGQGTLSGGATNSSDPASWQYRN